MGDWYNPADWSIGGHTPFDDSGDIFYTAMGPIGWNILAGQYGFDRLKDWLGAGGSTTAESPQMSEQENEFINAILDMISESQEEADFMRPLIMEELGYKWVWDEPYKGKGPTPTGLFGPQKPGPGQSGYFGASGTSLADEGYLKPGTSMPDRPGHWERMTEEERYARMTEAEKKQYDIYMQWLEREQKALAGELPISPALERDLAEQAAISREAASRTLGPGYETTTPFIQQEAKRQEREDITREAVRTGMLTTAEAVNQAREMQGSQLQGQRVGMYSGIPLRNLPFAGAYSQLMQPYQYYSGLQAQVDMANAAAQAQMTSGLYGGLGSLLGSGLMALGIYGAGGAGVRG